MVFTAVGNIDVAVPLSKIMAAPAESRHRWDSNHRPSDHEPTVQVTTNLTAR